VVAALCQAIHGLSNFWTSWHILPYLALRCETPSEKIRAVRYYLGETALELMEETDGHGEAARFIERRGGGGFLASYRVGGVAEGLKEFKDKGVKTIDQAPRRFMGNRQKPSPATGQVRRRPDRGPGRPVRPFQTIAVLPA